MAAKTPIRTVYTNNVATGLAEFQSGEFIDYQVGGTGVTALGSAGQVLKVNSGASALEWGGVEAIVNIDGATDLESATLAVGDKILLSDGGTEGRVLLSQLDTLFSGTSKTLTNKTLTSPVLNTGVSGSAILDEDAMGSNSATQLATQQSIKAYVDSQIGAENTLAEDNDVNITSAADGSLLLYDTGTSTWRDAAMSGDATISDTGVITLGANSVDSAEITTGAIDLTHMSANSVDSDQYVDGSIDLAHLAADSVDGTKIADDAIDSEHYTDGSIDLAHLAADSVDGTKIADDAIDSEHYAAGSIDNEHIADDAIDSEHYAAGSIDLEHMSANSVDSDQYVDGSIDLIHMSANSVDSDQYVDGSVDNIHLANSTITVSDGSNSTATSLGDTVTFSGTSNEVTVAESSGTITIGLPDDVTISGNLTVSGDTTTVNTATLSVEDPLIIAASGNDSADVVDIGLYGLYDTSGSQDLYSGLFRDANDSGKWKLFKDLQAAPTTTVNTSGTGYAVGTLVANLEGNVTGNVTGNTSGTALTVTQAAQSAITSLGTLTTLSVDNITINGNDISSTAGTDLTITPLSGQQIVLDGTIVVDAGVVTGATSITSTAFVGDITGDITGNADTATALANARTIGGTSFDGTANIAVGLAGTATALATARTIAGQSFDGTGNITIASTDLSNTAAITLLTASQTLTNKTLTSPVLNTGVSGSAILDEDAMGSNSATQLATQQSIKAYVDAQILTKDNTDEITEGSNLYFTNARADARITNALKDEDDFASNSATHLASQQSIKAYVDAQTTDEVRQDIIGAMLTGNTETLIAVTYQDSDGTVDFVVDNDLANYDNSNSSFITGLSTTTLTNKTFDVDGTGNSLSNIANANIKAAAAIDATKIADGSISNAEYQYLNGVSSNVQTQLNAKATSSQSIAFALALG